MTGCVRCVAPNPSPTCRDGCRPPRANAPRGPRPLRKLKFFANCCHLTRIPPDRRLLKRGLVGLTALGLAGWAWRSARAAQPDQRRQIRLDDGVRVFEARQPPLARCLSTTAGSVRQGRKPRPPEVVCILQESALRLMADAPSTTDAGQAPGTATVAMAGHFRHRVRECARCRCCCSFTRRERGNLYLSQVTAPAAATEHRLHYGRARATTS